MVNNGQDDNENIFRNCISPCYTSPMNTIADKIWVKNMTYCYRRRINQVKQNLHDLKLDENKPLINRPH